MSKILNKIKELPVFIPYGLLLIGFVLGTSKVGEEYLYLASFIFLLGAILFFLNGPRQRGKAKEAAKFKLRTRKQLFLRGVTLFLGFVLFLAAQVSFLFMLLGGLAGNTLGPVLYMIFGFFGFGVGIVLMVYPSFRNRKSNSK